MKQALSEKTFAEKAEETRVATEKAATAKAEADRIAAEKAATEKVAAEKVAAEKAAEEHAAAGKAAAEKAAAAAQATADKAARDAEIELARQNEINRMGARSAETKWNIARTKNQMTDRTDIVVRSIQKNEQGLVVGVEGYCKSAEVAFSALVVDENGKPTINLVGRTAFGNGSARE